MDFIDISSSISPEMTVWPGAPRTEFQQRRSMSKGDRSNNSNFLMNAHSGTHVDAPLHFLADGMSIDQLSLNHLIGPAFVFDFSDKAEITTADLEKGWPVQEKVERVLFKTRDFQANDFCALREKEARWLMERGICLIGIDAPSIQYFGADPIVHQLLLGSAIIIIEGLCLSHVSAGKYELFCLPLKLVGLEGAPARAVLKKL